MDTRALAPSEDHRVGKDEAVETMRRVLEEADVKRVSVRDAHGHTMLEVPVRADEVGLVMAPVVAATKAVADTVGEVVLRVEKEAELPPEGGTRASIRERERAGARRQATGAELQDDITPEEVAQAPTRVTAEDAERIEEANAVPEGSESAVERIEPEPSGEPELEGTGKPPKYRQR